MPADYRDPANAGRTAWRSLGMQMVTRPDLAREQVQAPRPWGVLVGRMGRDRGEPLWFTQPLPSGWKIVLGDLPSNVTKELGAPLYIIRSGENSVTCSRDIAWRRVGRL